MLESLRIKAESGELNSKDIAAFGSLVKSIESLGIQSDQLKARPLLELQGRTVGELSDTELLALAPRKP